MSQKSLSSLIESLENEVEILSESLGISSLGGGLNRGRAGSLLQKNKKKPAPAAKMPEPKKESKPVNANRKPGPTAKVSGKKESLGISSLSGLNRGNAGSLLQKNKKKAKPAPAGK